MFSSAPTTHILWYACCSISTLVHRRSLKVILSLQSSTRFNWYMTVTLIEHCACLSHVWQCHTDQFTGTSQLIPASGNSFGQSGIPLTQLLGWLWRGLLLQLGIVRMLFPSLKSLVFHIIANCHCVTNLYKLEIKPKSNKSSEPSVIFWAPTDWSH